MSVSTSKTYKLQFTTLFHFNLKKVMEAIANELSTQNSIPDFSKKI